MKRCARCLDEKPLNAFGLDPRMTDGHKSWCRPCVAEDARDRWHGRRPLHDPSLFGHRARIEVCICPVAIVGDCTACDYPIVTYMAPHLRREMARKYPPILDQTVLHPDYAIAEASA